MNRSLIAHSVLPALLAAGLPGTPRTQADPIVVAMAPCDATRPVQQFYVKSSRALVRKGTVQVGEESFDIYLPKEKACSHRPRPEQKGLLVARTSTYLAVDQDHDGKIGPLESYFADSPLRLGDTMFDIVDLAADGSSLTIRRSEGPLTGAVLGRKAAAFEWTTADDHKVTRDSLAGRVVVIDCWAPS